MQTSRAGQRLFDETVEWCAADDLVHPFSFLNACAALDLDADTLRRRLLAPRRTLQRWGREPRSGDPVPQDVRGS